MTDKDTAHRDMANAIRALAMDAVQQADSGHPGMPMGMADVPTVLFSRFPKFNPAAPHWPDRDPCEAASGFGWERWLGTRGAFVGMQGFGASAKASDLYKHFSITAEALAAAARRLAK